MRVEKPRKTSRTKKTWVVRNRVKMTKMMKAAVGEQKSRGERRRTRTRMQRATLRKNRRMKVFVRRKKRRRGQRCTVLCLVHLMSPRDGAHT